MAQVIFENKMNLRKKKTAHRWNEQNDICSLFVVGISHIEMWNEYSRFLSLVSAAWKDVKE